MDWIERIRRMAVMSAECHARSDNKFSVGVLDYELLARSRTEIPRLCRALQMMLDAADCTCTHDDFPCRGLPTCSMVVATRVRAGKVT